MSGADLPVLLLLAGLFATSAFFSGTEVALFSLDRHRVDSEQGPRGAAIRALLSDARALLATILVGNEIVNISISVLSARILGATSPDVALPWWFNIVVVTPVLLLVGDILPKALAANLGPAWALAAARPLLWFQRVVTPARLLLQGAATLLLRPFGNIDEPLPAALQEKQFRALVTLGEEGGALRGEEARLIHRVFDLSDTPVSRVMTKRSEVESVAMSTPLAEIVETVRGSRFSRLPVHNGDEDQIRGVLLTKDLLRFQQNTDETLSPRVLERALKAVAFVPPSKTCGSLLREFQKGRQHMAVVIDEFGSMLGIVTMHDLLEELFEPIPEELDDRPVAGIDRIADGTWRVAARVEISDWNRELDPPLPAGESYTTVAGYVMHLFGRLPKKGEEVSGAGWTFHVAGVEGTRLVQFTVRPARATGAA